MDGWQRSEQRKTFNLAQSPTKLENVSRLYPPGYTTLELAQRIVTDLFTECLEDLLDELQDENL
jgi:hypothetical protein